MALINTLGNVAGFFSTIVVGWLTQMTGNTQAAMYVMAAILLVGGGLGLTVNHVRKAVLVPAAGRRQLLIMDLERPGGSGGARIGVPGADLGRFLAYKGSITVNGGAPLVRCSP